MTVNRTALLELIQYALTCNAQQQPDNKLSEPVLGEICEIKDPVRLLSNLCMKTLRLTDANIRSYVEAKAILVARAEASATDDDLCDGYLNIQGNRLYFLANLGLREIVVEDCGSKRFWVVKPEPIV